VTGASQVILVISPDFDESVPSVTEAQGGADALTAELLAGWIDARRCVLAKTATSLSIPDSIQTVGNEVTGLTAARSPRASR
jgi:hypothetical protein